MMWIRKTLAILGTALALAGPATADDTYTREVAARLALATVGLTVDGWTLDQTASGMLYQGEYQWVSIMLAKGRTYTIVGACDYDCYDLALSLYSDSGALIRTHSGGDAFPAVTLKAPYSGYYMVKAPMRGCQVGPCEYGLAVFID